MLEINKLIVLIIFSTSLVESVNLGGACNPLNPLLWCDTTKNLHCDADTSVCVCNEYDIPTKDGQGCLKTFEILCNADAADSCNYDRGLRCVRDVIGFSIGHCKCKIRPDDIFSLETQSCVGLAYSQCNPDSTNEFGANCHPNAECDPSDRTCKCKDGFFRNTERMCEKIGGSLNAPCTSNSDCDWNIHHLECGVGGRCECASTQNYHLNAAAGCSKDYGTECTILTPCDDGRYQSCSSYAAYPGHCQCKAPEYQIYNEQSNECESIVGKQCEDDHIYPGIKCIANAECHYRDFFSNHCECMEGFIATHDNRTCRPIVGPELGEACESGVSECSGSLCLRNEAGTGSSCQCPENKTPNKNETRCYLRQGQQCNDADGRHCNADKWQACGLGRCSCTLVSDTIYDAGRDSCVGLHGGLCTIEDSPWALPCTDNASCNKIGNAHRCRCNEGFVATPPLWKCEAM